MFTRDGIWDVGGPQAAPFCFLFSGRDKVVEGVRGLITSLEFLIQTNHALVVRNGELNVTGGITSRRLDRSE